jgi:acyl-CoA synthetase (AMP-forming)/AMP-acid ligase II
MISVVASTVRPQRRHATRICVPRPSRRSLPHLLTHRARTAGAEPATRFAALVLNFQDWEILANRLAHHLIDRGVEPSGRVALCLSTGPSLPVAILAVQKAGAADVLLSPDDPADCSTQILQAMTLDDFMAVQRGVDKSDTIQWKTDGCSGPTEGELDRMFEPACIRHNFGSKRFGPRNLRLDTSEASFKRVNDIFRKDLMSICTKNGNPWVTNKKVTVKCGLAADATHRTVVAARRTWWDA